MAHRFLKDRFNSNIRSIGKGLGKVLAVVSPPAYFGLKELLSEEENSLPRKIGNAVYSGLYSGVICFLASSVMEIPILVHSPRTISRERIHFPEDGVNLYVEQEESLCPDNGMISRKAALPAESWIRYVFDRENFPKEYETHVSGTIKKQGLEFNVKSTIPGKVAAESITPRVLSVYPTELTLSDKNDKDYILGLEKRTK